jgi:hypothetical protein
MPAAKLTSKQRRLQAEIEDISSFVHMDHYNILEYPEESRTTHLELMRRQLILGEIVTKYTFIDEMLSVLICHYFFPGPREGYFPKLWKTTKFQIFAHHILDDTYLLNKLKLVHTIDPIPSSVRNAIERINAVRNALAHSFFPENRRQYRQSKAVMYRDSDIHTKQGLEKFVADFQEANAYLWKRAGFI